MSVHTATVAGRQAAEARMLDVCEVGEFGEALDPITGQPVLELISERYAGPCRISSASNAVREAEDGGQSYADETFLLSVPIASGGSIRTDDTLRVVAVDAVTGNPAMVDRTFRVAGLASVSQATAARFSLELLS